MDRKFENLVIVAICILLGVLVYQRPTPAVDLGTFDTSPVCRTCNSPVCACLVCKCDGPAECSISPISRVVASIQPTEDTVAVLPNVVCENGVCRIVPTPAPISTPVRSGVRSFVYSRTRFGSRLFSGPILGFGGRLLCRVLCR